MAMKVDDVRGRENICYFSPRKKNFTATKTMAISNTKKKERKFHKKKIKKFEEKRKTMRGIKKRLPKT